MMASSKIRDTIECSGSVAVAEIEHGFKKDKIRAKANFTRTQNILLSLIDDNSSSHCQVIEARKRLGSCLEIGLYIGQEAISLHKDIMIIGRCVISVTSL